MQTTRIPATVVTGFLGSGKTTLVRHILEQARGLRVAVIVNEFGELGIDGEILEACAIGCKEEGGADVPGGRIYELANGCMCCTVQEEFFPVMKSLAGRRDDIDVLLIETSGLALPKPLVQAFQWPEIASLFTVDSVVTVVDAPAVAAGQFADDPQAVDAQRRGDPGLDHEASLHELFEDQLSAADLVVLSKADLVTGEELARVRALVAGQVPPAVKMVEAVQGRVPLSVLLGRQRAAESDIDGRHSHHDHDEDHDHDAFDSLFIDLGAVDRDRVMQALQDIVQRHAVLRVKGFVALPGKKMRLLVQGVGRRLDAYFDRAWREDEAAATRLVFIGKGLDAAALREALAGAAA